MEQEKQFIPILQPGKPYPSTLLEAILITLIFAAASVVAVPVLLIFSVIPISVVQNLSFFAYYLTMVVITTIVVYALKSRSEKELYQHPQLGTVDGLLIFLLIPLTLALQQGVISPLISLIPIPEFLVKFLEIFNNKPQTIGNILTMMILAPIFEEYIFRGVMLDGLLKRYSPQKAILFSALLFGVIHFNPWQFVTAFILGVFAGWIYYRTKSLLLCILIHFVNNGFVVLYTTLKWNLNFTGVYKWMYIGIMLLMAVPLFFLIQKRLANQEKEEQYAEEESL